MMNDEWAPEIREASRGISRAWGPGSRTSGGKAPDESAGLGLKSHPRFNLGGPGAWPRLLLKHWAWIALTTIAVTAGATVVAFAQPHVYRAQAEVAVSSAAGASSALQPFVMGTEKGIASSGNVLAIASQSLSIPQATLLHGLSVTVPVDTDLLVISYTDPNPVVAQSVAESVAQAYIEYRTWKSPPVPAGKTAPTPPAGALEAAIVTDATLPIAPQSPYRRLIVAVAALLGLALGIALALARDAIDDGLRGSLDLESQTSSPVLAEIPAFSRKGRSLADALVVVRNPTSTVAEAYRNLRTRVLQTAGWRRSNLLLVTSPGGEDKTTVAANLAAAIAFSGRRVVLVCADLRWGRDHALFGLDNRVGLSNLIAGDLALADALRSTEVAKLRLLSCGRRAVDSSSLLQSPLFSTLLAELRSDADMVVIDAPPVLTGAETAALAELGAMTLLVADARTSTRAQVRAAMHELGHVHNAVVGWVLDNTGRPLDLPQGSRPAATPDLDAAAVSTAASHHEEWTVSVTPNGNGTGPNHEQETTPIHGEV